MKDKKGSSKQYFYLRVVNRVYLVKTVDVSLFANRAFGASGSAGVPQPVQLLNIANATDAAQRFAEVNRIISGEPDPARAAGAQRGGAAASACGGCSACGRRDGEGNDGHQPLDLASGNVPAPPGDRLSGFRFPHPGRREPGCAGGHFRSARKPTADYRQADRVHGMR